MDNKSFRIYNASTRSVRESRNVIFIETPPVLREPDLVNGFDEVEFIYDEYDDMVRDVRNYNSNLDLASPSAADGVVGDPSVRDRFEQIRATTTCDLCINPASSVPSEHPHLLVIHQLLLLREGTLQGQVKVLIRMVALVVERRLFLHLVVVLYRVVDVVPRGCSISRWTWCHYVTAPCYLIDGEPTQRNDHQ